MAVMFQRRGIYYASYQHRGKQVRASLRTTDPQTAERTMNALSVLRRDRRQTTKPQYYPEISGEWTETVEAGIGSCKGWLSVMYGRVKDRATHRHLPFYLSKVQLKDIALRSEGRCELTGLPFSWDHVNGWFPPYAPSLDRIIPKAGYHAANCRLICHAVNVALSDWGEDVFRTVAAAYLLRPATANLPKSSVRFFAIECDKAPQLQPNQPPSVA